MKSEQSIAAARPPKRVQERRLRTRLHSESGQSLVELAFVLPILFLLVIGAIDFGRAFYLVIEVSNAARAGVQYGATTGNLTNTTGMQTAASADAPDVPGLVPVATWGCECSDGTATTASCAPVPSCGGGTSYLVDYVQVNTTAPFNPIIPWPGVTPTSPLTFNGQAKMHVEE
jgi:Flp pilus assembly protein TadG